MGPIVAASKRSILRIADRISPDSRGSDKKEEEVSLHEYRDLADARQHIARFLDDVYLHKRVHSALGYLPPGEFEAQWYAQQAAQRDPDLV